MYRTRKTVTVDAADVDIEEVTPAARSRPRRDLDIDGVVVDDDEDDDSEVATTTTRQL